MVKGFERRGSGLRIDTPIKDLIERGALFLRGTEGAKADVHGRARPLPRRVLLTDRGLKKPHVRNAAESPLRFDPTCFPPASPAFASEGGEAENDPEGPF